jgi:hypothetical protein
MILKHLLPILLIALTAPFNCGIERKQHDQQNQMKERGAKMSSMNESSRSKINVTMEARPGEGWKKRLVPEQAATFEILLTNTGTDMQNIMSLDLNRDTPNLRLLNGNGDLLMESTSRIQRTRMLGTTRPPDMSPPVTIDLPPGGQQLRSVNLWKFTDPAGLGNYLFEATHQISGLGETIYSNRVSFSIEKARIHDAALGYDLPSRSSSILAWTASLPDGEPQLFIRLSGTEWHGMVREGATPHGPTGTGARITVGKVPYGVATGDSGWIAVTDGKQLKLIKHDMSYLLWQSPSVTLPLSDVLPVPHFPNRGHALFLATGHSSGRANLTGVIVSEGQDKPSLWQLPLSTPAVHAVCSFGAEGAITILFSSEKNNSTIFTRLSVDEKGKILSPEKSVHSSSNDILAMSADMRPDASPMFFILEADPEKHDHLGLTRIPVNGEATLSALAPVKGWPFMERQEYPQPQHAVEISLEIAMDGTPFIALTDETGALHGGPLASSLVVLRDSRDGRKATYPHIGALANATSIACFTETGALFHATIPGDM